MQIETLCILGHTDNDKDRLQHLEQQILLARSRPLEVVCEKGVLRNVAKFTGKHLSQSLFFNKVAGLRPASDLLLHNFREI